MRVLALFISLLLTAACFADSGVSLYGAGHGSSAAGGPEISDDFSSDTTANYTVDNISSGGSFLIADGVAKCSPAYKGMRVHHNTALSSSDHYVSGSVIYNSSDLSDITLRVSDSGAGHDDYYEVRPGALGFTLYRVVDGSATYLADGAAISVDTTYSVRAEISGTDPVNIKVYVDGSGTPDINYDDSNAARIQTGTLSGFRVTHTSSGLLDTYVFDNFQAGAL